MIGQHSKVNHKKMEIVKKIAKLMKTLSINAKKNYLNLKKQRR